MADAALSGSVEFVVVITRLRSLTVAVRKKLERSKNLCLYAAQAGGATVSLELAHPSSRRVVLLTVKANARDSRSPFIAIGRGSSRLPLKRPGRRGEAIQALMASRYGIAPKTMRA